MIERRLRTAFLAILLLGGFAAAPTAQAASGLSHDSQTRGPVPIPPSERSLQTAQAELWFKVSDENLILEGAIFDADGNLLFCDVTGRRVLRLTPDKQLSTVVTLESLSPGGLAFHPDGRLFIAAINLDRQKGSVFAVNPDGSGLRTIIPPDAGYLPNDLAFDSRGGFYFTDFKGTATDPRGGVYYASPDFETITPVIPRLAMANGVALSPDGRVLWATEFGRNLLHRAELADPTTLTAIGSAVPYHFVGPAPDSMRTDTEGNVYVAVYGQGRVLAFNSNGIPIGQILLPGRDQGYNLLSTSLAIRPGTSDLYAVTCDGEDKHGATIFHSRAFAEGRQPFSSRKPGKQ